VPAPFERTPRRRELRPAPSPAAADPPSDKRPPNGLTYYVRCNGEPKGRAEIWLVVNAGSMQEGTTSEDRASRRAHGVQRDALIPPPEDRRYARAVRHALGPDVNA
jgi:zinc protease